MTMALNSNCVLECHVVCHVHETIKIKNILLSI